MADPTLTPDLADKVLDPNNLVAVVTVGLLYMMWKFMNRRFDLEREEQRGAKILSERMMRGPLVARTKGRTHAHLRT